MKKLITRLFILLISLGAIFVASFGFNEISADSTPTLVVQDKIIRRGEIFSVDVEMTNNTNGFCGFLLELSYNHSVMELISWEKGEAFTQMSGFQATSPDQFGSYKKVDAVRFLWDATKPDKTNGVILTLTFQSYIDVNISSTTDCYYSIKPIKSSCIGADLKPTDVNAPNTDGTCKVTYQLGEFVAQFQTYSHLYTLDDGQSLQDFDDLMTLFPDLDLTKEEDSKYTYEFRGWEKRSGSTDTKVTYDALYYKYPKSYDLTIEIGIEEDEEINFESEDLFDVLEYKYENPNNVLTKKYGDVLHYLDLYPVDILQVGSLGYTFYGFFSDEDCTIPFTNETMPDSDKTIYGYYKANSEEPELASQPVITVSTAVSGTSVSLSLDLSNNSGIYSFIVKIPEIDGLTFSSITYNSNSILYGNGSESYTTNDDIYFEWTHDARKRYNFASEGHLFKVNYTLDEDASVGDIIVNAEVSERGATRFRSDNVTTYTLINVVNPELEYIQVSKPESKGSSYSYNGSYQSFEFKDEIDDDYISISNGSQMNVGSYTVTASLKNVSGKIVTWDDGSTTDQTYTFVISQATYDLSGITFEDDTVTYDKQSHSIVAQGTIPDGLSPSYTGNGKTNVGEYTITLTFTNINSNYVTPDSLTATLKITPCLVDIPDKDTTDFTYDGTVKTYNVASTTLYDISGNKETDAGSYTVTITLKDKDNYTWTDGKTDDLKYDFVINKRSVTIPSKDVTVYTYNKSEQTYVITESDYYTVTNNKKTNAGSYTVTVSLKDTDNSKWSDDTIADKTYDFNIAKKKIIVNYSNKLSTYDGSGIENKITNPNVIPSELSVAYTYSDSENGTYTATPPVNVGIYYAKATFTGDLDNYDLYQILNKDPFDIDNVAKATIEIEAAQLAGVSYSDKSVIYDGTTKNNHITGTLPEGITVEYYYSSNGIDYSSTEPVNAGSYYSKAHYIGTGYSLTDDIRHLYILKATYNTEGLSISDDVVTYDGETHSIYVEGEIPEGLTVSYEGNEKVDKGIYSIKAIFISDDPENYNEVAPLYATLTIKVKVIEVPEEDTTYFVYTGQLLTYQIADNDYYIVRDNTTINAGSKKVAIALKDKSNTVWSNGFTTDIVYDFIVHKKDATDEMKDYVVNLDFLDTTKQVVILIDKPSDVTYGVITTSNTFKEVHTSTTSVYFIVANNFRPDTTETIQIQIPESMNFNSYTIVISINIGSCAHEHVVHKDSKNETCMEIGNVEYYYCDYCDRYYSDSELTNEILKENVFIPINPDKHNYPEEWTSDDAGHHYKICNNNINHKLIENCSYVDTVINPTCEEDGYTLHTCSKCSYSYKDTYVTKLGHYYDPLLTVWTWNGYKSCTALLTCSNDNTHQVLKDAVITADRTNAPTATDPGVIVYTATVNYNNQLFTTTIDENLDALGHTYGEPTFEFTKDGYTYKARAAFVCTCGHEDTHILDCDITEDLTQLDKIKYTAKVIFGGREYTKTLEVSKPLVRFDYNNGITLETSKYYNPGDYVEFKIASKLGYKFIGWGYSRNALILYSNGEFSQFRVGFDDIDFIAKYNKKVDASINVFDRVGTPLKDIKVQIKQGDTLILEGLTNIEGTFEFEGVAHDNYKVLIIYEDNNENEIVRTYSINLLEENKKFDYFVDDIRYSTHVTGKGSAKDLEYSISEEEKASIISSSTPGSLIEIKIEQIRKEVTDTSVKEAIIKKVNSDNTALKREIIEVIDFSLKKTVYKISSTGTITTEESYISNSYKYQTNYYPVSTLVYQKLALVGGSTDNIFIYKRHEDSKSGLTTITRLEKVSEEIAESTEKECFYIKNVDGIEYIAIRQKQYSAIGIGVDTMPIKKENTIKKAIALSWNYGSTPNYPLVEACYGNPIITYSSSMTGEFTSTVPTEAGHYYVKYVIPESEDYLEAVGYLEFDIYKLVVSKPEEFIKEFTYNSLEQEYEVETNALYEIIDNKKTDAGNYIVKVVLKDKVNYCWDDYTNDDVLFNFIINKATYDMSGISLNSATFEFDKESHSLYITGELPDGVTVTYIGNGQIESGYYQIIARFTISDPNFNEINDLSAILTINDKKINLLPLILVLAIICGGLIASTLLVEGEIALIRRGEYKALSLVPFILVTLLPLNGLWIVHILAVIDLLLTALLLFRIVVLIKLMKEEGINMRESSIDTNNSLSGTITVRLDSQSMKTLTTTIDNLTHEVSLLKDKLGLANGCTCPLINGSAKIEVEKENSPTVTKEVKEVKEVKKEKVKEVKQESLFSEEDFNEDETQESNLWFNEDGTPVIETEYPDFFKKMLKDLEEFEKHEFFAAVSNCGIRSSIRRPMKENYFDEAHFLIHFFSSTRYRSMVRLRTYEIFHDILIKYLKTDFETSMLDIKMINIYYLNRNKVDYAIDKCKEYCLKDIDHELNVMKVRNVRLASIKKYITILTNENNFDEAIKYCDLAISYGLIDFKEEGFENRKQELIEKKEKEEAKALKAKAKKRGRKKKSTK